MKIAVVQLNTLVGDVWGNSRKILKSVDWAKRGQADLVCFHEMALLGYPPRDLLEMPTLIADCQRALKKIASQAEGIAVLVGAVVPNPDLQGKPLTNAAVWCENGRIRQIIPKRLLPSYDVFDESRYFEPGRGSRVIPFGGQRFGVTICEDLWSDSSLWNRKLYPLDPVKDLVGQGANVILNLSASPYNIGKFKQRAEILEKLSRTNKIPIVYINQVGGNDELVFDGGSFAYNGQGHPIFQAPFFKEHQQMIRLDGEAEKFSEPLEIEMLEEALILGLKDYVKKCGFSKVTLGLSGGIDSSVVALLAVRALGADNVLGVIMPSRYSSPASQRDAQILAKNLNIKTMRIPLSAIHQAYEGEFKKIFGRRKRDATEENIQARIRGNILMAISNKLGHLVLSTGNKSELAVGYCTLYGDMSGGLAVLSDVPKTQVYELARWMNQKKFLIPETIFEKPPSAELRPNQTDQDSLPPYEMLDRIIKAAVEEGASEKEIVAMGYKPKIVREILYKIHHNEHKRRQAAPGLKVTSKAFGVGRRLPIACKI